MSAERVLGNEIDLTYTRQLKRGKRTEKMPESGICRVQKLLSNALKAAKVFCVRAHVCNAGNDHQPHGLPYLPCDSPSALRLRIAWTNSRIKHPGKKTEFKNVNLF